MQPSGSMRLFTAKLVERQESGQLMISIGLVGFLFICFSLFIPSMAFLTPLFLLGVLVMVVIGAVYYKGNLSSYKLENDLSVFEDRMVIKGIVFPLMELMELSFECHSYNGMPHAGPSIRTAELTAPPHPGMNNKVAFQYKGQRFTYLFYLQDHQHHVNYQQMLLSLRQLAVQFNDASMQ